MATEEQCGDAPDRRPVGGVDAFDALFVRIPIRDGETPAVRTVVREWVAANRDGDARTVLPAAGVNHCTLFLDARGERNALVWYVEVVDDDTPAWADPLAAVRESPLFDAGLADPVAEGATVHADGVAGHQLVVNASHPERQSWYGAVCDHSLVAPVAGDDLPIEVAMVAVPLRPGLVSWLTARLTRVANWLKRATPLGAALRDQTAVLAEERLYSESLLLEPRDGRQVLHYYMETESMTQLYEGFEASDDWTARVGRWVLPRILARPEVMLDPPLESDYEVLFHAVDPNRG
jgi:hypothetical protein